MAWPPPTLPINRTDSTPQGGGVHSGDHNAANLAINDLVSVMQSEVLRLPPQVRRATPVGTNPVTANSILQTLTIPADPSARILIATTHLLITVGTAGFNFQLSAGLAGAPVVYALWGVGFTGDQTFDGTIAVPIAAGVGPIVVATSVGAMPGGNVSRTWGTENVNYLHAYTIRGTS